MKASSVFPLIIFLVIAIVVCYPTYLKDVKYLCAEQDKPTNETCARTDWRYRRLRLLYI